MKTYLHEHISKAITECEDEIERRKEWLKTKDYNSKSEKQAICDDLIKFNFIKQQLENIYESARTFKTY